MTITMRAVCARIAITLKAALRKLSCVDIQIVSSTLAVCARLAICETITIASAKIKKRTTKTPVDSKKLARAAELATN